MTRSELMPPVWLLPTCFLHVFPRLPTLTSGTSSGSPAVDGWCFAASLLQALSSCVVNARLCEGLPGTGRDLHASLAQVAVPVPRKVCAPRVHRQ